MFWKPSWFKQRLKKFYKGPTLHLDICSCSDMVKVLKERIHSRDNSFGKSNGKHVYRYFIL